MPTIRAFWAPKAAAHESEWEDAAAFDEAREAALSAIAAACTPRHRPESTYEVSADLQIRARPMPWAV